MLGSGKRATCSVALVAFALVLGASGCKKFKETFGPPVRGSVVVRTATGGANIDPDGYQVVISSPGLSDLTHDFGANDSFTSSLSISEHTVTLNDIAANCSTQKRRNSVAG